MTLPAIALGTSADGFVMFPTFASQIKLNDKINGSVIILFLPTSAGSVQDGNINDSSCVLRS